VLHNLQALRGVAVTLVVLLHLANAEWLYGTGRTPLALFAVFGLCGVDLLFVISGYLMATLARGQFQRPGSRALFVFSRASRIYPPYWAYTLALLAAHWAFPALGDPERIRQVDAVRSLLLLPQAGLPFLVVGWTLVHELYFYIVIAATLWLPERLFVPALLGWAGIVAVGGPLAGRLPTAPGPAAQLALHPLTLEFIAGALAARLLAAGRLRRGLPVLLAGAALLPALYAAHGWLRPGMQPADWARLVVFGAPALLLVAGACAMGRAGGAAGLRLLEYLGDRSYTFYLTHVPVIVVASRLVAAAAPSGMPAPLVASAVRAAAVLAAGFAGYALVESPLHRSARSLRRGWLERRGAARLRAGVGGGQ
jgi:peptidoglycan/LPS O-acetylase OafA/YrhL